MKIASLVSIATLALVAGSAFGQSISGDTTGGPTWNRPLAGNPPTGLSAVGTATPLEVIPFTVNLTTSYTFQNTAAGLWDNFTFVYINSFDPNAALTNAVIGNDDNPTIGLSGFTVNLSAGTNYFFVTTGFANSDFGAYNLEATSSTGGVVTFIPAPSAMALLGLGGLAAARRRRA